MATQYRQISLLCFGVVVLMMSCGTPKTQLKPVSPILSSKRLLYLQDSCFTDNSVGYLVTDVASGAVLEKYRPHQYFTPASTTKLATTYLTLKYIGDSLTRLSYRFQSDSVVVRPFGDPTFLDTSFERNFTFFDSLCRRYPQAKFVVQFPSPNPPPYAMGWSWEDYSAYFFRPYTPLSIANNQASLYFKKNHVKTNPSFLMDYVMPHSNFPPMGGAIDLGVAYRDFFSNRIELKSDTFVEADTVHFTVFPRYEDLANMLSAYTQQPFGWMTTPKEQYSDPKWKKIKSTPTKPVLRKMLVESDNFIAQQLLLQTQLQNNWSYDMKEVMQHLVKSEWKDMPQPMFWIDGSGLSRYNANTPQNLVYILKKIASLTSVRYLQEILPTVGQGTLRSWKNKELKGRLFAKTGTMRGVYCLAGMLITKQNHLVFFALMINGKPITDISCIQKTVYDWFLRY